MNRYTHNSSSRRRKSVERVPYNFIFAVQKKFRDSKLGSQAFGSNLEEHRPIDNYCMQTTTLQLHAKIPFIGCLSYVAHLDIEINLKNILTIRNGEDPIYLNGWKRPALHNFLCALRDRINQSVDLITHKLKTSSYHQVDKICCRRLSDLLRVREKLLIYQITTLMTWLEVKIEKLNTEKQFNRIADIQEKKKILLLNMNKERQNIHRLLRLIDQKCVTPTLEGSKQDLDLQEDIDLLLKTFKNTSSINDSQNSNLMEHPMTKMEYFNLYFWLLKKKIDKNSLLYRKNIDAFKQINKHYKPKEFVNRELTTNKYDFSEASENMADETSTKSLPLLQNQCNIINNIATHTEPLVIANQHEAQLTRVEESISPSKHCSKTQILQDEERLLLDRLKEDLALELFEECKKGLSRQDASSNSIVSLLWLRCTQTDIINEMQNFPSNRMKFDQGNDDPIDKFIRYELCNVDLRWENLYAISVDVIQALVDELILQHITILTKNIFNEPHKISC
ncbi:uncharacterized protein LOC133844199 [Drosophila sulfurigaster albostrigata]|uniref:uncharacterized protein LOC133844199 n=1 Tax=Drosophila sulfurigaster albostrigata TaxID=89887 RepID=UPI002D21E794|nr:uncharacterized protein LOC133844199 [Drosophila sulfurigaster albostrigata]